MRILTAEWLVQHSAIYAKIVELLVNSRPANLQLYYDLKRQQAINHEKVYVAYKKKYNKNFPDLISNSELNEINTLIKEMLNINDASLERWRACHNQGVGCLALNFLQSLLLKYFGFYVNIKCIRETNYYVKDGVIWASEHFYITHVAHHEREDIIFALNGSIKVNVKVSNQILGYELVSIEVHSDCKDHEQLFVDCFLKNTVDIEPQGTALSVQGKDDVLNRLHTISREECYIQLISRSAEDFMLVAYGDANSENFIFAEEIVQSLNQRIRGLPYINRLTKVVDKIVTLTDDDYFAKQTIFFEYIDLMQGAQEISDAFPYIVARFKPLFIPQAPHNLCIMNFFDKIMHDDFANFLDAVKAIWRKKLFADVDKKTDNTSKIALLCISSRTQICNFQRNSYFAVSETSTRKQVESKLSSLRDDPTTKKLIR